LRSAAEIAKEPAYRARRFAGCYCNFYLKVAEDVAGADDHRNRSNGFGLGGGAESGGRGFTAIRIRRNPNMDFCQLAVVAELGRAPRSVGVGRNKKHSTHPK
jgi:hypothetical protein